MKQTKGAERWLAEHPERIFLDRECTIPFPIVLPPSELRQVHRVVVANGCADACRRHIPTSSGSLILKPDVQGSDHWSNHSGRLQPFVIGDVDPDGSFVHVLNETALDVLMRELDTISDFTDYLSKKVELIRSGRLVDAHGEENLLAYYAIRINDFGDHDFIPEDGQFPLSIDSQHYPNLIRNPQYIARKEADSVSYLWDKLIKLFTNHMLGGTSITLDGYDFDISKNELGVRYMALVPRFIRRSHSEAVIGALEKGKDTDRFLRVMMSPDGAKDNETGFFIHTFKYLEWMKKRGGYEKYRNKRTEFAQVCARGLLVRYPHLKRVIGISREPPGQGEGVSEDLVYAEQAEWSEEDCKAIQHDCKAYGVLQNLQERRWEGEEFPSADTIIIERPSPSSAQHGLNRKQRRAMKAKTRRRK